MLWWFLAAMALRLLLLLQAEPFWYDETFSVLVARLPWARLLEATAGDVHPPLYYGLLKLWLWVLPVPAEIAARALSVVLSLLALWIWWAILETMADIPTQQKRLAFILAAFMPGLVYFSIEARMYALLSVCVLAAFYCFLRDHPVLGGVFLGLGALTHNAGLLYAVAVALTMLYYRRTRSTFWMMVAATGVVILMYLPWAAIIIQQIGATNAGYWTWLPTLGTVIYMQFKALYFVTGIPARMDSVLMLLIGSMTTFGLWVSRHGAAVLAVLMLLISVLVSYVTGVGVLLHRALIPAVYFVSLAWAKLLTRRDVGLALGSLAAVALLYGNALFFVNGRLGIEYSVLDEIEPECGDIILAVNYSAIPLGLYTETPVVISNIATRRGMETGLSAQTVAALGLTVADPESIAWERAWLVWVEMPGLEEERAYIDGLVAQYHGQQIGDGWDNTPGGLWLLQR